MTLDTETRIALDFASRWPDQTWAFAARVREKNAKREAQRAPRKRPSRRTGALTPTQKRSIAWRRKRGATVPEIVASVGVRRGLVVAYLRGAA